LLGLLVHSDYSNFVLFFERIEFLVFVLKENLYAALSVAVFDGGWR